MSAEGREDGELTAPDWRQLHNCFPHGLETGGLAPRTSCGPGALLQGTLGCKVEPRRPLSLTRPGPEHWDQDGLQTELTPD